jgi:hypothetical protein
MRPGGSTFVSSRGQDWSRLTEAIPHPTWKPQFLDSDLFGRNRSGREDRCYRVAWYHQQPILRSSVDEPRSLKSRRASHLDTGILRPSRLSGADSSRELTLTLPSFPSSGKNSSHVLRTSILRPELASSSGRLPLWSTVLGVRVTHVMTHVDT